MSISSRRFRMISRRLRTGRRRIAPSVAPSFLCFFVLLEQGMEGIGESAHEFIRNFAYESRFRSYLEFLRWLVGVSCLRCKAKRVYRVANHGQFLCAACRYEFSVTAGTVFHDTHLPLVTWFRAGFRICEAERCPFRERGEVHSRECLG
jgi:transposase-like protein